ncbi:MAG: OmpA family protein [Candidatus Omnitrophota bacterium]
MKLKIAVLILLFCFAGCASGKGRILVSDISDIKKQLSLVSAKFEAAKKENLTLKRELVLYKKSQDIDTGRFIEALDIFEKEFSDDIAKKEAWIRITDRGLVITASAEELFISGSDALSDEGKAFLDKVFEVCKVEFPDNYLYIEGHTDNQSLAVFEWKSDWDFSFARALSVVDYFTVKKGMDPLRLSASGFGRYRPRTSNDTKEGRSLNRRVEIIVSPQRLKHIFQGAR